MASPSNTLFLILIIPPSQMQKLELKQSVDTLIKITMAGSDPWPEPMNFLILFLLFSMLKLKHNKNYFSENNNVL